MLEKCKYSGSCIPKCKCLNCHQLALGKAEWKPSLRAVHFLFPIGYVSTLHVLCIVYPVPYPSCTQSSCSPIHCEASWYLQQGKMFACLLCGWQMQCHMDTTSSTRCTEQVQLITLYFSEGFEYKALIVIICSYTLYMHGTVPLAVKVDTNTLGIQT